MQVVFRHQKRRHIVHLHRRAALQLLHRGPHGFITHLERILHHHGITSGSLLIDDTDNPRSKAAHTLAHLYKLRDKESGGYLWGQSLVFLVLVTPKISIPVGFTFYQPAPELSAWYKQEKALKKQGIPKSQRLPKPPPNPRYPTKQQLALRLLEQFKMDHPGIRVHCIVADALYGTAPFVDGASALFGGVQVLSQARSNQNIQVHQREQHLTNYFAAHPGTPQTIRIRGGDERVAMVRSARLYVCAHKTKRFIVAIKYEEEETYRYLMASDLTWRTLDIVQGHSLRWLVEVFVQDWKGYEGWAQLTKQPGEEGARRSVILSLLVDHALFVHPAQEAQLKNNLPAYTVGSLRAHVQVECLVDVIEDLVSSDDPQSRLQHFTKALHEVQQFPPMAPLPHTAASTEQALVGFDQPFHADVGLSALRVDTRSRRQGEHGEIGA